VNIGAVNYLSLRLKLDDVITSRNTEIKILENIRYCNKIVGDRFRVVFWNENLTEKECQKFIERNENLLFEVNTKITKEFKYAWFLISSKNDKSNNRYTYKGTDIVFGISEYLKLARFLIKKDMEE
jgi:hypothetical protein